LAYKLQEKRYRKIEASENRENVKTATIQTLSYREIEVAMIQTLFPINDHLEDSYCYIVLVLFGVMHLKIVPIV
jgi:hypothetical protein